MSKRRCSECRDGEHENYDDDVRLVVIRDPDTNKIFKRSYMCATHVDMCMADGYDIHIQKEKSETAMTNTRDSQREKVYASERPLLTKQVAHPVEELQEMADAIVKTEWWKNNFPHKQNILIRKRGGGRAANYRTTVDGCVITVREHSYTRSKMMLLHEIAHINEIRPWHGEEFCNLYLTLIKQHSENGIYGKLIENFDKNKVKYNKRKHYVFKRERGEERCSMELKKQKE